MVAALLLHDARIVLDRRCRRVRRGWLIIRSCHAPSGRRVRGSRAGCVSIALPPRSTMRSDCGRDWSSVQLRARNSTRSAGAPTSIRPDRRSRPSDAGGRRRATTVPGRIQRMIEMQDARALAEHLDRVEIAIGVERVAGIVRGDGDRDAGGAELVEQGDAAPARRAAPCRYGGPAGTCCTSAARRWRSRPRRRGRWWRAACPRPARRATQQWPAITLPVKPVSSTASADGLQRQRAAGSLGLVDVEVEIEAQFVGRRREISLSSWRSISGFIRVTPPSRPPASRIDRDEIGEEGVLGHGIERERGRRPAARSGRPSARAPPRTPPR